MAGPGDSPLDAMFPISEAPPPPVQPATPATAPAPTGLRKALVTIQMTNEDVKAWRGRISKSEEATKAREGEWDMLWKAYLPTVNANAEDVKYHGHFRNVHTKMGQLFVRSPEVRLSPKGPGKEEQPQPPVPDPMTGMMMPQPTLRASDGIAIRQAVINEFMGPDYIDAKTLMDQCCLDVQAYSGFTAVLVSYRSVSKTIQRPIMGPDPTFVPPPPMPGSLGLNTPAPPQVPMTDPMTGQPQTQTIQVPIYECWEATRLHPKKVLFDERLKSDRHDKDSRWIGQRFFLPVRLAQRQYGLTDLEVEQAIATDDRTYLDDTANASGNTDKDLLGGHKIWLKSEYFLGPEEAPNADNPEMIVELVFFDCVPDAPVVYRPSLDQTFDDTGALTDDSLVGFPLIIGSLRPTIDSPYPKSDSAFTNSDIKHLNTHRRQMVQIRDASVGKVLLDSSVFDDEALNTIKGGTAGDTILVKSGTLASGADKVMANTSQVHTTPDDWRTAALLKADMDETLGISAPQAGGQTDTVRSATEIATMNSGSVGRSSKEQDRLMAFFLKIVRAVDTLIFRNATGNRYVMVAGDKGAQELKVWNRKIGSGRYSYDIKPDSQLAIDVTRDRQQVVAYYNVVAPDPLTNRAPILREIGAKFGMDPMETVLDPNVVNANMAMQQKGIPMGQPPHGGGPVNKHAQEQSGARPNQPGAAESGDNRQERNPRGAAGGMGGGPA